MTNSLFPLACPGRGPALQAAGPRAAGLLRADQTQALGHPRAASLHHRGGKPGLSNPTPQTSSLTSKLGLRGGKPGLSNPDPQTSSLTVPNLKAWPALGAHSLKTYYITPTSQLRAAALHHRGGRPGLPNLSSASPLAHKELITMAISALRPLSQKPHEPITLAWSSNCLP